MSDEKYEDLTAFRASVARWEAALLAEQQPPVRYSSRTPEASRECVGWVRRLLYKHEGSTLRVYLGLKDDGLPEAWDAIVAADGTILGAFNDSWLCPPIC